MQDLDDFITTMSAQIARPRLSAAPERQTAESINPSNCAGSCERKSKRSCFDCMDRFYNHLHDESGGPLMPWNIEREKPSAVANRIRITDDTPDSAVEYDSAECAIHKCTFDRGGSCAINARGKTKWCARHKLQVTL